MLMCNNSALYKQATEGDCCRGKPSLIEIVELKKWEAWMKLKGVDSKDAAIQYCTKAKAVLSSSHGSASGHSESARQSFGKSVSRMTEALPETTPDASVVYDSYTEEFLCLGQPNLIRKKQAVDAVFRNLLEGKFASISAIIDRIIDQSTVKPLGNALDLNKVWNKSGSGVLHYAVDNEKEEAVDFLLSNFPSINVDMPDCERQTPLAIAVLLENEVIISKLLRKGADPKVKGADGLSALQQASSRIQSYILNEIK